MTPEELLELDFTAMRHKLTELSNDAEKWYLVKTIFDPTHSIHVSHKNFGAATSIIAKLEEGLIEAGRYTVSPSALPMRNEVDDEEKAFAKQRRFYDENFSSPDGDYTTSSWGFTNPALRRPKKQR
jgi:hypothetical protein